MSRTTFVLAPALVALLAGTAAAQGFRGEYYTGYGGYPRLTGPIAATRVDAAIAFSDSGAPGTTPWNLPAGVDRDRHTVRWTATFTPPAAGAYGFTLTTADDGVLIIDGRIAIDHRGVHARASRTATVTLTAAPHLVELYAAEAAGESHVVLTHTPPGGSAQPIPPAQLRADVVLGPTARRVDFDALADGTYLTDQLASSDGVRFASDHDPSNSTYTTRPRVIGGRPGFAPSSPPHMLYNESNGIEAYEQISANVPLTLSFARPQRVVAVRTGRLHPASTIGSPTAATLSAYDAGGNLVGADRVAPLPDGTTARLAVARGVADIATVAIDVGGSHLGELIDDLELETDATATPSTDRTPPAVEIVAPTAGATEYLVGTTVPLRVRVREDSGVIASVVATGGTAASSLFRTAGGDPSCVLPTCAIYEGNAPVDHGRVRLTVTARDGAGNDGSASVELAAVRRTSVTVVDENGRPVEGAELYVDGVRHRATSDAAGRIDVTPGLRPGATLVARARVFEAPAVRGSHAGGGTRDWSWRVYNTSRAVNLDGSVTPATVADPLAAHTLRLLRNQSVIGLHLVMSVEWDASQAELDAMRDDFIQGTSSWLYNATDGQMVVERLELLDNARTWDDADFRLYADWTLRANVNCRRGGFLGNSIWCGTWMHMARSNGSWVYAHEFGHYGLDLGDEYTDAAGALCTADIGTTDADFGMGGPRQSCIMAAGGVPKLCSGHADNPHLDGTRQGATSCWSQVALRYRDEERARGFLQRWFIRTPTERGGIVGRLADMPAGWRVAAPALDNQVQPGLCAPFAVTIVDTATGARAGDTEVWLRTRDGRSILQGKTDARATEPTHGMLTVTGVHVGDRLEVPGDSWTIASGQCTPVAR